METHQHHQQSVFLVQNMQHESVKNIQIICAVHAVCVVGMCVCGGHGVCVVGMVCVWWAWRVCGGHGVCVVGMVCVW